MKGRPGVVERFGVSEDLTETVELEERALEGAERRAPVGAFSFRKGDGLRDALNDALYAYLGTEDHRRRMANYGLGASEIDGALRVRRDGDP